MVGGEVEVAEEQFHVFCCHSLLIHQRGLGGQVDAVSDVRVLAAVGIAPLSLLTCTG